jgi:exodeoxyribonuclease VII large subunit
VSQLKGLVDAYAPFRHVAVTGELASVKHHPSGHWYFVLKDAQASLRGVLFRRDAERLAFPLQNGMAVQMTGRLSVFDRDGQTQLYAVTVTPIGEGAARLALEALHKRLKDDGVFRTRPRPLPVPPRLIGVITAASGAARRDIEAVTARRWPGMPLRLFPALVQGTDAPLSLVAALQHAYSTPGLSVLIIGRGGGAQDDLSAFNDEQVVRMVAKSPIPIISAVGHEIDTSLTDWTADYRAPTPSAAAELAVPDRLTLTSRLTQLRTHLLTAWHTRLALAQAALDKWAAHPIFTQPDALWQPYRHQLDTLSETCDRLWDRLMTHHAHQLDLLGSALHAADPLAILDRGYAVVSHDHHIVTASHIADGQSLTIQWHDGTAQATVTTHAVTSHLSPKESDQS